MHARTENGQPVELIEDAFDGAGQLIPIESRFSPDLVATLIDWPDGEPLPPPAAPVASTVPVSVTMVQARLALLDAGLLDHVATVIAALPGAQGKSAAVEWEFRQTVERDSPLVALLGPALALDDTALDALFAKAATF